MTQDCPLYQHALPPHSAEPLLRSRKRHARTVKRAAPAGLQSRDRTLHSRPYRRPASDPGTNLPFPCTRSRRWAADRSLAAGTASSARSCPDFAAPRALRAVRRERAFCTIWAVVLRCVRAGRADRGGSLVSTFKSDFDPPPPAEAEAHALAGRAAGTTATAKHPSCDPKNAIRPS